MEQQFEKLGAIKNPAPLFNTYYRRDNGIYFVESEFLGQGTRDLYMLANIKGAFTEQEVGTIAE